MGKFDSKEYAALKNELLTAFKAHLVSINIVDGSEKGWELHEVMVQAPLDEFHNAELDEWENSSERQEFLKTQAAKARARFYA